MFRTAFPVPVNEIEEIDREANIALSTAARAGLRPPSIPGEWLSNPACAVACIMLSWFRLSVPRER
jgi:hypothetical protein